MQSAVLEQEWLSCLVAGIKMVGVMSTVAQQVILGMASVVTVRLLAEVSVTDLSQDSRRQAAALLSKGQAILLSEA